MPGIIRGQAGHSPIFLNLPTQSEIYEWENEATGVGGHALIWLPTKIQWVPRSFAFFGEGGGYHEGLQLRSYTARSWNEIFVQPSFTRTGPASSNR